MKKNSNQLPTIGRPVLEFPTLDNAAATLAVDVVREITGASLRTVNRWRRTGAIPAAPLRLLQLHHAGQIVPDAWQRTGARFNAAGELVVGVYVFRPGELAGYGVMLAALRDLEVIRSRERAAQRAQLDNGPSLIILPGGQEYRRG